MRDTCDVCGKPLPDDDELREFGRHVECDKEMIERGDATMKGERLTLMPQYDHMENRAMRNKLERGECIDLSRCRMELDGSYIIPPDVWQEDIDYCNAQTEGWIWSIGRETATGIIRAAHDTRFYQNPEYHCLWLR